MNGTSGRGGPDSDGLRRIFLQNFLIADGKVRPRTGEDGLPPASLRIISPYDLQARFAMRGDTRWAGYNPAAARPCHAGVAAWTGVRDDESPDFPRSSQRRSRLFQERTASELSLTSRFRLDRTRSTMHNESG